MNHKRKDYISWDEYFMGVSVLSGMRSKDPNTQVGACIVGKDNRILSMGYNGFPNGCSDEDFPWDREGDALETKYPFVTHSELNAILNYRGGSLEVQSCMYPCFRVMSVQKRSYRRESERLCMTAINTKERR